MGKYDVFISYRREGGYETAKHLSDLLRRDGYKVSFDIDTLRSGDFDIQLYERIDSCRDFILILDKHSFDRTVIEKIPREKDWLRCELAYALYKNKNVVPIFLTGFTFPNELPNDIVGVIKKMVQSIIGIILMTSIKLLKRDSYTIKEPYIESLLLS